MIVPCPKCDAKTQLDLSHITEDGTSAKCPECNTRFWITKESFARRAIKKEGKSLCYYCNGEIGSYLDCPTCGVIYPDSCIVQTSKPVKRKKRKASSTVSFSLRPQRRARGVAVQQLSTTRTSKPLLVTIGLLALVALLVLAVGIPYLNKQREEKYSAGFFRTLYGIKLGTDLNFKQCRIVSEAAKGQTGSVQALDSRISDNDKARMKLAKGDIDILMQKLPKAPEKFARTNESLNRLYDVYTRSYMLATTTSGSAAAFAASSSKLESEFRHAAQDVKSSMPPGMAEDLKQVLPKYKELQDL